MIYILVLCFIGWKIGRIKSANLRAIVFLASIIIMGRLAIITDQFKHFPGLTAW